MSNHMFPTEKTGPALFKKYLEERGILPSSIEKCGLQLVSMTAGLSMIGNDKFPSPYAQAMYIPYGGDYGVVRALGEPKSGQFSTLVSKKIDKLIAPKGDVHVYIPPLVDWEKFSGTLYLCESAIKAIALAQHGYTAIGGNGVSGLYTNSGFSKGFPTALLDGGKVERVVILFDANWQTNVQVAAAIRKLATGINQHHPSVPIIHKQLPLTDKGGDQGIDDWLAKNGVEALHEWLGSDDGDAEPDISPLQQHLDEISERYVVTSYPAMITDRLHRQRVSRHDFVDVLEASRTFMEKVTTKSGVRWIEVQPAKEWLKWEKRTEAERKDYTPGGAELGENAKGTFYNTWYDDGVAPASLVTGADVEPFLRVYKNATPCDIERSLTIESMAWMLQNRGTRLEKCFAFVGADQGTGKSLLVETLGELVGQSNFVSISPERISSNFNAALHGREVILIDDVVEIPNRTKGLFKNLITGRTVLVELKGVDPYKAEMTGVVFITSNEFSSIPLDPEDRRVHVCSFNPTVHYPQGHQWWKDYNGWLEDEGGLSLLRAWLEGLDLSDFDPDFMPPMTATKIHMGQARMTDVESWVESLWEDKDVELLGNARSFYTGDELAMIYHGPAWPDMDPREQRAFTNSLGQHLNKRFRKVGTSAIRTVQGRARYWGIRVDGGGSTSNIVASDVKKHQSLKIPN